MRQLYIALILFSVAAAFCAETAIKREAAISEALSALKMRERDLSVRSLISDPFRFSLVDRVMEKPTTMPAELDSLGLYFTNSKLDATEALYRAAEITDQRPTKPVVKASGGDYPWKGKKELPVRLREALDVLFAAFEAAEVSFAAAFSEVDSFQMDSIKTYALDYIVRDRGLDLDIKGGGATIEELDEAELEGEVLTKRIFDISSKIKRNKIAEAALSVLKGATMAEEKVVGLTVQSAKPEVPDSIATGDIVYFTETKRGLVIVGGPGRTIYKARFAVIIDLGGDDIYLRAAGGAIPTIPFSVCIDLAGNDLYRSSNRFAFGSGGLGIGVLLESGGDDTYISDDLGIAAGSYGAGILVEKTGDDRYNGDVASMGSATMGYGLLLDRSGNDAYSARLFSQGFGYVGGLGILSDSEGNDQYIVQGASSDQLSFAGRHLSASQGFGYGNRPDRSGGIGLLLDAAGNDSYVCEIFGQGAAYWLSFGGLWDGGGNDNYFAYQYAQGSATHTCAAMLFDKGGEDCYISRGASQGCGHDLAVGYLLDGGANNDNYSVWDLSQGAGNANGVGIFIDEGGDDGYICKKEYNVQGYGNWRRDFGSKGIMLDLSGNDKYICKGVDSSWWMSGQYGIGIDFPAELSKEK